MSGHGSQPLGATPPGGVYLCQAGGRVSCGACCGLYNVADAGRETLAALLASRSASFARVPREMTAILGFAAETSRSEEQSRPLPYFHHCPFLGLVGEAVEERVGCLLHPMAAGNHGLDWRGLSHYGGMACRVYFCHSHSRLPAAVKSLLRACADNWYDYGLMITETRLILAFFQALSLRMGRFEIPDDSRLTPAVTHQLKAFLALKRTWRYRPEGLPLCHDLFASPEEPRPAVDYGFAVKHPSLFDTLLRELGTRFETPGRQRQAEAQLSLLIDNLAAAWG